jgi:hypothetical protein
MGPAAAGPKAILGLSGGSTQLEWVPSRTYHNIFSLSVLVQPNPILIYLKIKLKKIQKY